MSGRSPSVAVVLTCCNEGDYIGTAVRSVLEQSRANVVESIVIADDGSRAETLAALAEIERWDPRIRVLYGPGGAGPAAQRNLAIAVTQAPIVAILDGDDFWTPNKLEVQLPVLAADASVGLVYSSYYTFPFDDVGAAREAKVGDLGKAADQTLAYFLGDPPILPSTTLMRRDAFDACGGFDPSIRVFEETDLYLRLSRVCRFACVAAPLLYKRFRSTSITGGRRDLMAHHALVAFRAAERDSRLLPLVPRRLAERARKLGNQQFLLGDRAGAKALLHCATRLDPLNVRAWMSLLASGRLAWATERMLAPKLKSRRLALGIES